MDPLRLSAIIPTYGEAPRIARTVAICARVADEVIVADAESPDATLELAAAAGAKTVRTRRGRGLQLNTGASLATGDVLLFVHADTELPEDARTTLARVLRNPQIVGGNFKLRFRPETPVARLFSLANHLRRKYLKIYYGDSCIFARRAVFDALGGFRELPIFEDYDFARRLEAFGKTHYECSVEVASSSRRFAERPIRTLAIWAALQTLYSAGIPAARLAKYYKVVR